MTTADIDAMSLVASVRGSARCMHFAVTWYGSVIRHKLQSWTRWDRLARGRCQSKYREPNRTQCHACLQRQPIPVRHHRCPLRNQCRVEGLL